MREETVSRLERLSAIRRLVPSFLRPYLRPVYRAAMLQYGRLMHRPGSREQLHDYWRNPVDPGNRPDDYVTGDRSRFLVDLIQRHDKGPEAVRARILEIGCNVGRNLEALRQAGFPNLTGIEINPHAIELLRQTFPELGATAALRNAPVEEVVRTFVDREFDVVYSMAVLEHLHRDSEWVFAEMARISNRWVITIEDEYGIGERHFPRNYGRIFTALGYDQVEVRECADIEGLGGGFYARVFRKL